MQRLFVIIDEAEKADAIRKELIADGLNANKVIHITSEEVAQRYADKNIKEEDNQQNIGTSSGAAVGALTSSILAVSVVSLAPASAVAAPAAMIAAFAAFGVGSLAGGLAGALTSTGADQAEAEKLTQFVRDNNSLLLLEVDNSKILDIEKKIMDQGPVHITRVDVN